MRDYMEIKSGKGKDYPPLIKDLVKELLKDDFVHFKILCANEVHHFNKEEDPDIFRVKLYRDMEQYIEDEKKFNAFNDDDDWTGNRIQF